jgi:hypothetical protein
VSDASYNRNKSHKYKNDNTNAAAADDDNNSDDNYQFS